LQENHEFGVLLTTKGIFACGEQFGLATGLKVRVPFLLLSMCAAAGCEEST
jgi:hypothetical protein